MKGTMIVSEYQEKRGYYLSKDVNSALGGDYWFIIAPLNGNSEERYFYVEKQDNGKFKVKVEGYIVTKPDNLKEHQRDLEKEINTHPVIYYCFLDKNGSVERTTAYNRLTDIETEVSNI